MSNDTAAFFANKKKKKGFKFNANLVDAEALAPQSHVDAPAVSTDGKIMADGTAFSADPSTVSVKKPQQDEEWDDGLASDFARKANTASEATVRDIKSLDAGKHHSGNIAEKLRVEETKAALAAAREGMEREARLLKEKKETDEAKKQEAATRFSGASATVGVTASKWTPPSLARVKLGAASATKGVNRRFNAEDEELFPDLASADKIIEQKEKEQQNAFRPLKKTPVGGGASWANKPTLSSTIRAVAPEFETEAPVTSYTESTAQGASPDELSAAATPSPASTTAAPILPASDTSGFAASSTSKIAPVKKKKKDLSTFKPKA
ncbi:hypothetical protein MPSEU_000252200 [Mayamaea pseudoterrestris]|nr:hypothetical protein MPSEU_000252200 [Mayamaea pseudoterrestris]